MSYANLHPLQADHKKGRGRVCKVERELSFTSALITSLRLVHSNQSWAIGTRLKSLW